MTHRLITADQAKELDHISMEDHGITGVDLMGNAGRAVADAAKNALAEIHEPRIIIVCGKGNNGGDGFSAALHLTDYHVTIISLIPENEISGDALHFHEKCISNGLHIHYNNDPNELGKCDLIIDAILGTGCLGPLKDNIKEWTQWINSKSSKVLSVDISTGVNGNNGSVSEHSVRSDTTVTFGYPKIGSLLKKGQDHSGTIESREIGFADCIDQIPGFHWSQFDSKTISTLLPSVQTDSHKHRQGKVLLIAGSRGMTGAAVLSTFGAFRSGAGLTITCAPRSLEDIYEKTIIEGMTLACEDGKTGHFTLESYDEILEKRDWCDSVVIGPGIGRDPKTIELLAKLYKEIDKPMVIDADGLRIFHEYPELIHEISVPIIITPHEGEFCDLIKVDKETLINEFPKIVEEFMIDFPGVLILKNAPTITFHSDQAVLNCSGNTGMATAGMGDVLAGILGTFLSQAVSIFDAAKSAVYLHGLAADRQVEVKGKRGLIASDLLDQIPIVLNEIDN